MVCAQLIVMADDVYMVRRSRVEVGHLMFADYSTDYVELGRWYLAPHFDDCTDGYLFTKDRRLAAEPASTGSETTREPVSPITSAATTATPTNCCPMTMRPSC